VCELTGVTSPGVRHRGAVLLPVHLAVGGRT
jgi:hypothetical protein